MKPGQGKSNVPPQRLLDAVKDALQISSDRELAKQLKVLPSAISKIRKKQIVSASMQIAIHKRTKWDFDRIEFLIGAEHG